MGRCHFVFAALEQRNMDMFQDLGSFVDREIVLGNCSSVLISEVDVADSCFLVVHLVARHLVADHGVCLVTTTRTFHHYNQLGSKLGIQFQSFLEKGQLLVIEGLKLQLDLLRKGKSSGDPTSETSLKAVYERVKEALETLNGSGRPYFLIVDDASVWINIGLTLRQVLSFIQCCRWLTSYHNASLGTVVCEAEEHDDHGVLCRLLSHWCDMKMRVANLTTGYSKDVHGQLMIFWRNRALKTNAKVATGHFHYKVEEKRVLMFAPGTSTAVLKNERAGSQNCMKKRGILEIGAAARMAVEPKPLQSSKGNRPEATVEKLTVALRIRPLKPEEHHRGDFKVAHIVEDKMVVLVDPQDDRFGMLRQNRRPQERQYVFDVAFDGEAPQEFVYRRTTQPLVDSVMNGFNATVFAYGATGAGKTYTMVGNDAEPGIMIYNEMIRDLLDPSTGYLELREDAKRVQVVGLTQVSTNSTKEVMEMLTKGNRARTVESTSANRTSSRSHALLEVYVQQQNRVRNTLEEVRAGKLYMIDLAGSERASNTQNRGKRLVEGAHINRSLLALGNCINALAEKGSKYVNYRDSKLTRLLKDALSGNCRTVMIAHISPAASQFDESRNTLVYADRAKNIRNKISRNVVDVTYHVAQYQTIIDELRQEIQRLKTKMDAPLTSADSGTPKEKVPLLSTRDGHKELSRLREDLVKTFNEQMELRRQLMEVDAHVLTLSIEFEKQSMVVGEWEAERNKRTASLFAQHPKAAGSLVDELEEEPAHVRQAWDDLMFIQDEQQRYWDVRMEIERQFGDCQSRAAKTEEELPYHISGSEQRELLLLLCKVHELEIEKMEMQAESLLKEHELRRKDMMILRYGRQRNLSDEIIQRQKVIIDAIANGNSGNQITCPPELQELYDRYRLEVEDIAHREQVARSAAPKSLLLPELDSSALLEGRRRSIAQKLPRLKEENKLFIRRTTVSNSGSSQNKNTPSRSSLTAPNLPHSGSPILLPPIESGRETSSSHEQLMKDSLRSINVVAARRCSVRTSDRRNLELWAEARRTPKPRGASVVNGGNRPSNPVLHRRRYPSQQLLGSEVQSGTGVAVHSDLGLDFPKRVIYIPPSLTLLRHTLRPTTDAEAKQIDDRDQLTISPSHQLHDQELQRVISPGDGRSLSVDHIPAASSPLAVPPADRAHHPHSVARASS